MAFININFGAAGGIVFAFVLGFVIYKVEISRHGPEAITGREGQGILIPQKADDSVQPHSSIGPVTSPVVPNTRGTQVSTPQYHESVSVHERLTMVRFYGASTYEAGTVVVGARAVRRGTTPEAAAGEIERALLDKLRANNIRGNLLRSGVYESGQFERLVGSNLDGLRLSGLLDVVGALILVTVESTCQPAAQVEGVHTCTILVIMTRITRDGVAASYRWSETGAAATEVAAVLRAAEIALQRHPEWLIEL